MIWTNELRSQLLRFQCTSNTSHRRDSQKHMITFLELKVFPSLIMITFLSTLRRFHLLLYQFDLLRSLLYNFWSQNCTLTSLEPTQRSSASPTIQCLKRRHSNARMVTVVISELYQR